VHELIGISASFGFGRQQQRLRCIVVWLAHELIGTGSSFGSFFGFGRRQQRLYRVVVWLAHELIGTGASTSAHGSASGDKGSGFAASSSGSQTRYSAPAHLSASGEDISCFAKVSPHRCLARTTNSSALAHLSASTTAAT